MSKCPIEPSKDRVVLLEDSPEEITKGGLLIPTIARDKSKTSRILAIGPECAFYQVGDHVIHTKYSGVEVEMDRVIFTIVPEDELMGRLPDSALVLVAEDESAVAA